MASEAATLGNKAATIVLAENSDDGLMAKNVALRESIIRGGLAPGLVIPLQKVCPTRCCLIRITIPTVRLLHVEVS